ncbi:head decoration protein [Pseudoxanthomonas sp. USHLN014]|uniref:head decoration protein n=1 Tax=Pseudoxanthomonas sp. USHLN014 TaxID=3081297 RepID=UPI00301C2BE5
MNPITEKTRFGDFLLSEANGSYSRENEILASGQNLQAGTVLGAVTASGKYTILAPGASDGSQTAGGILLATTNASAADAAVVVVERAAEVKADALIWPAGITNAQKTAAIAQLNTLGIVLR